MNEGQRVKSIRKFLRLTQKEFVKPLDIDQGTLSHIEKCDPNYPISKKTAARLVSAYKVNLDYIFNGNDPMFTHGLKKEEILNEPAGFYGDENTTSDLIKALKRNVELQDELRECERERAELQRKIDELTFGADDRKKIKA